MPLFKFVKHACKHLCRLPIQVKCSMSLFNRQSMIVLLATLWIIFLVAISRYNENVFEEHREIPKRFYPPRNDKPLILMYTPPHYTSTPEMWAEQGNNGTARCTFTGDANVAPKADLVVFHGNTMPFVLHNLEHPSHQYWLWFSDECPPRSGFTENYRDTFNLTLTYDQSSELYYHLTWSGLVYKRGKAPDYLSIASRNETIKPVDKYTFESLPERIGEILWIVSHCDASSGRDSLWDSLTNSSISKSASPTLSGVKMGECGTACTEDTCDIGRYWFYFAAENTLCNNYITEKFLKTLNYPTIPVVYGAMSRRQYELIAPPNSFIYAEDFDSPDHLARYLIALKNNPREYMKYFEWRKDYDVLTNSDRFEDDMRRMLMDVCYWTLINRGKQFIVGDLHKRLYSVGCRKPNNTFLGY